MMQHDDVQHWLLIGNSTASETVWGVGRIGFPAAYLMPPIAFAGENEALEYPSDVQRVYAMGGLALEVNSTVSKSGESEAEGYIAGYRPWLAIYSDYLVETLERRRHTVETWDRGVGIFYGMWREKVHALGGLIPASKMNPLGEVAVSLSVNGVEVSEPIKASDYAHMGREIVPFMSAFMTLSPGDVYILGPIACSRIDGSATSLSLSVAGQRFVMPIQVG